MKEKRQLKKVCRYHRVSHNERLEALISLNKDCIWIKIDSVFDVPALRRTRNETFISYEFQYDDIILILMEIGVTEKLARKVKIVLSGWKADGLFSFDEAKTITINGGQGYENIRKN